MTNELQTLLRDNQEVPLVYTLRMLREQPETVSYGEVELDDEPELVETLVSELEQLLN